MHPITKEEAQEVMMPYLERIRKAVIESINTYFIGTDYIKVRHKHSLRTDASICHDLIVDSIEKEFSGVSGTYFSRRHGLFMLEINGKVVLRFKKFNRNLKSSGIDTQQSMAYILQEAEQLELPNMPSCWTLAYWVPYQ